MIRPASSGSPAASALATAARTFAYSGASAADVAASSAAWSRGALATGERIRLPVVEASPGVLADRLEHRVAVAGEAQEALLDERLQRVELGLAHLLGGLQRRAAHEHGQAAE